MKELVLYRCEVCGNFICMVEQSDMVPVCCGRTMHRIEANTEDSAAGEKHVPVIIEDGTAVRVRVGETEHPSLTNHHIEWIALLTDRGSYAYALNAGEKPEAEFRLRVGEETLAAYAYCNLHGLWVRRTDH